MNRRQFILGMASAAAIPIIGKPSSALNLPTEAEFMTMFITAYSDYTANMFIFGVGALRYTDTFPYVESVDPRDLVIDAKATTIKGLLT